MTANFVMQRKLGGLIAVLVLVGFFWWLGVHEQRKSQREKETSQRIMAEQQAAATGSVQRTEAALKTLTTRYNAIILVENREKHYLLDQYLRQNALT